ncbi:uncharacterized protein DUF4823 [Azomonas agilis]|uniref:Uncharacterized protein DUF4823 n=1 Tax=Azomonas agilis TaxID=116849 RepID=A0A562J037_9GAMM|nr:DUF4823 domain-containing protein [Azomonas agilis]TWH76522.1 uncharacterized protein DUF4823 [Azomonas agilis]
MRLVILSLLLLSVSACMKVSDMADGTAYHMRDAGLLDHNTTTRVYNRRLQPDSYIYIAQGSFVPPGKVYPRPNVVAEEAFKGFVEYFPMIRRANRPQNLEEALTEALNMGANYVLYTRFAAADDRVGSFDEFNNQRALDRVGVDSGVIQAMLIETTTRYLVDTVRIHNRGGLFNIYEARPEDLIRRPFEDYAQTLLGLGG